MGRGPAGQNVAGNAPTPRDRASGPQGPMGGTGEAPAGRWDLPGRREQGAPNQVNLEEGAGSRKSHRSWQRAGGGGGRAQSGTQRTSSLSLIPSFVPKLPPHCCAFQPWAGWDPAGRNRTNPAGLALPLTVTRRAVT